MMRTGIIWPESVAPFDVVLINMKPGDADCDRICEQLYDALIRQRARTCSTTIPTSAPAASSPRADLIGLPRQVIVGPRGVAAGEVEVKDRANRRARHDADRIAACIAGLRNMSVANAVATAAAQPAPSRLRGRALLGLRAHGCLALSAREAQGDVHFRDRLISFVGIMLGVATLIIVMAVMNGFRAELLTRILGINGHLIMQPIDPPLDDYDAVTQAHRRRPRREIRAIPLIEGQVLAKGNVGARARRAGARHARRRPRKRDACRQTISSRAASAGFDTGEGVAIGTRMAEHIGLVLGDKLTLISPDGDIDAARHDAARQSLSGRRDFRGRHVGVSTLDRLYAALPKRSSISTWRTRLNRSRSLPIIRMTSMR